MALVHAMLSLVLAAVAVFVLSLAFERPRGWARAVFVILFLGIWAGGAWVAPKAAAIQPAYWLPFLLIAVLLALVVAVLAEGRRRSPAEEVQEVEIGLGVFFWLLVVSLIGVVVAAYLH